MYVIYCIIKSATDRGTSQWMPLENILLAYSRSYRNSFTSFESTSWCLFIQPRITGRFTSSHVPTEVINYKMHTNWLCILYTTQFYVEINIISHKLKHQHQPRENHFNRSTLSLHKKCKHGYLTSTLHY